ncbi:phage portal protein [Marinobacter pelagius]|uniref:Phage portal protein, lambda family n=1 Tax=Marinobacter pelagius TaxID=379482 RepID=A0A1I4T4I7_9GAMM|nr:phage portal protein [Marinobacter pelagius]SFM71523.1 phage portal protein, lambda family [Marinobacter pelagius]
MKAPDIKLLDARGRPLPSAESYTGTGTGFGGQLQRWNPRPKTADAALLPELKRGNARAEDLVRNHGLASNGVQLHVDNIVGHLFRLSYKPRWRALGMSEEDARDFARDVEAAFTEWAEDPINCWVDAERKRTLTMMVREVVATHSTVGEAMGSAEWIERRPGALYATAIKMVNTHRVSNPNFSGDTARRRSGVEIDRFGAARAFWVRNHDTTGYGFSDGFGTEWRRVPRETSWGRQQFLHVFEPRGDGQTRGANQFLSVMEQLPQLGKLQQTKLQNAIVNAMYAAVIESELGSEAAMEIIGGEIGTDKLEDYMTALADYHEGADIRLNGVKIPHLMPGEELKLMTSSNADNGFSELESSIIRWIAAGLNVPYEALAKDYSKTTYSSARASMMEGWRYYMGRRKIIASRWASMVFALWLEEALDRGVIRMPRSASRGFYEAKASWCNAEWIGSGRLAIDGLKEVKESILLIESGLSTYEKELAKMGEDYQEIFAQQVREMEERRNAGLPPPSWVKALALAPEEQPQEEVAN